VQKGVDKMKINMKLLTAALVLGGAVLLTSVARADTVSIGLYESGYGLSTVATGSGSALFAGSYGTFTFNTITAVGTPPLPQPQLDSTSIDVSSSTSGTIVIYVTEQGITWPTGVFGVLSGFTMNILTSGWTVTEATYVDAGNGLYALTSPLGSWTFTGLGSASSANLTPSLSSPFSETEVFTIAANGTGRSNGTIATQLVPEPATLSLLGMGLLSLLGLRKKVRG